MDVHYEEMTADTLEVLKTMTTKRKPSLSQIPQVQERQPRGATWLCTVERFSN